MKLLEDINGLLPEGKRLDTARLNRAFENNWPALESSIDAALKLKSPDPAVTTPRTTSSMVTEILELVRELKRGSEVSNLPGGTLGFPSSALNEMLAKYGVLRPSTHGGINRTGLGMADMSDTLPNRADELGAVAGGSLPAPTTPQNALRTRHRRRPRKPED